MKLYVGNVSFKADDNDLFEAFKPFGRIILAYVVKASDSGRHRGFGFVELDRNEDAEAAMKALNGTLLLGRAIIVQPARPKEKAPWEN